MFNKKCAFCLTPFNQFLSFKNTLNFEFIIFFHLEEKYELSISDLMDDIDLELHNKNLFLLSN